jgi:hypothetical protein
LAVYTEISEAEVNKIKETYQLNIESFHPMEGGISNSNFLLKSTTGEFMLTIMEDGGFDGAHRLINLLLWFEKQNFFTAYGAMKTSNWRFWKYHIDKPNPQRKHAHRIMMNIAEKVIEIPTQTFINLTLK